jgi:hypothetical protein
VSVLQSLPFFIVLVLQLAPIAVVLKPKNNELNLKLLLFVLFINVYILLFTFICVNGIIIIIIIIIVALFLYFVCFFFSTHARFVIGLWAFKFACK